MKPPPDDKSMETLLRGSIRQPTARFEEALRRIPGQAERPAWTTWVATLRPLGIAAAILIALSLFLKPEQPEQPQGPVTQLAWERLDPELIELFDLADALADAGSLADEDTRLALEYYAFNP
jgi:hypothetical protein